ncbi:hypothetical protein ABDK00_001610 [Niabella insulamsoli]|uniref:hypothetical protein n=1 Tax=Niabella insulamsoli TaxID=3144874 RepID=UPI0031FC36FE
MIHSPGDKKLIVDFQELVETIKSSTPIDRFESAGDRRKRVNHLLKPGNYQYFVEYYFPDYAYAPMGWFHKQIPEYAYNNPNTIYLEQWSRGFAKSTSFGLFLPMYIKAKGDLNGVALGSLNNKLACERLADLQANLMGNQRYINDFGEQFSFGNWEDGAFKTKDDCGFYAYGKEQTPRGTRFKWKRPNLGLIDDLNMARQLKNDSIAKEDKRWVMEELKPALWTRKWWLFVLQNRFHENTVTNLIEEDEEIKKVVHLVNIKDENDQSNWPENEDFTNERVAELEATEAGGFIRERMNTPFEEGADFKLEWMQNWVEPLPLNEYDSQIIHYLDPSYKSTEKSDFKFWVLLGKKGLHYDILQAWGQKTTAKNMWEEAFRVDADNGDYSIIQHCMEASFIQEEVHKKELELVEDEQGRALRILFDRRDKGDKHARIMTMQSLFQRGYIRFNVHQKTNIGMKLLRSQLLGFEKGERLNDDGPDALEGAIWMADRNTKRRSAKTRSGKMNKKNNRAI